MEHIINKNKVMKSFLTTSQLGIEYVVRASNELLTDE